MEKDIQEAYVSYYIAKLLKEKGFNNKCLYVYDINGKFKPFEDEVSNDEEFDCWAPTQQMAMAYLRLLGVYIMIDRSFSVNNSWHYVIDFSNEIHQQTSEPNRSYEMAVEDALQDSLQNIY